MSVTTQRPQSDFLPKIGAGCLVMLGLFMVVSAFGALAGAAGSVAGTLVMALLGAGFGAAGFYWWRFAGRNDRRRRAEFEEKSILRVASGHGGIVTIALVALETELSAEEAREALDRLCVKGLAQPDILDDGTIQYRFSGLLSS